MNCYIKITKYFSVIFCTYLRKSNAKSSLRFSDSSFIYNYKYFFSCHIIGSSTPSSLYFLTFINYFTVSSLYVLLNFPIPDNIF